MDQSAQIKELQSTWLRSLLAGLIAFSLAMLLSRKPIWRVCLYLGVLVPVIVYLYSYAQVVITTKNIWHLSFTGLIDHKIVLGYVGVLFTAIAFGIFSFWSTGNQKLTIMKTMGGILLFLGIAASLASFILVNTRNGIGAYLILLSLWILAYLFQFIKSKKYLLLIISLAISIPLIVFSIQKYFPPDTLLADIKVGYQISKFNHWQNHEKGYPQNELGNFVNGSTYTRVAWATAWLRF
jgi:hypothetical protein